MDLSGGRREQLAGVLATNRDQPRQGRASFGALRSSSDLVDVRPARHLHEPGKSGGPHKGHQRRQSVARLLPDISKLRLLSWLVEASSELINCDITIMDGVYAKLNRSQESLLFWTGGSAPVQKPHPPRPAPPRQQPVASKLVISQQQRQERLNKAARNHHSLPISNYDASSLAAASPSARKAHDRHKKLVDGAGRSASLPAAGQPPTELENSDDDLQGSGEDNDDSASSASTSSSGIHGAGSSSLSSSVSTSSSSSSFSASSHKSARGRSGQTAGGAPAGCSPGPGSAELLSERIRRTVLEHNHLQGLLVNIIRQHDKQRELGLINEQRQRLAQLNNKAPPGVHSNVPNREQVLKIDLAAIAEALNDGCLCSCHAQRRSGSLDVDGTAGLLASGLSEEAKSSTLPIARPQTVDKVKLASLVRQQLKQQQKQRSNKTSDGQSPNEPNPLSTSNRKQMIQLLSDKLCENCFELHSWLQNGCLQNDDLYQSHKLLKQQQTSNHNCITETDYSIATGSLPATKLASVTTSTIGDNYSTIINDNQSINLQRSSVSELNAIIAKRNATFIKLVQQEVRSTISKSIDLIDLIRKEIKSPEYIKQKQLMKCFSSSIQLLTSVSNYVVPTQDISSFIPDDMINQQQNSLFKLPSNDFDHLLSYQDGRLLSTPQQTPSQQAYHLAPAPEIPIRRRAHQQQHQRNLVNGCALLARTASCNDSIVSSMSSTPSISTAISLATATVANDNGSLEQQSLDLDQSICGWDQQQQQNENSSSEAKVTTTTTNAITGRALSSPVTGSMAISSNNTTESSSSGASSNNSSASSSIARGTVQQSSITRSTRSTNMAAQVGSLPTVLANSKVCMIDKVGASRHHDLSSFEAIANLSAVRQQTEDDMLFQSRPKFWQSSKFNFIKKLLHVKQQRLLRQQSKDRRIYNNKVQSKFRLVMMDLTHFNKSQQLLSTENGVNSLLTSMRNVLEFGLYLTLKLY